MLIVRPRVTDLRLVVVGGFDLVDCMSEVGECVHSANLWEVSSLTSSVLSCDGCSLCSVSDSSFEVVDEWSDS